MSSTGVFRSWWADVKKHGSYQVVSIADECFVNKGVKFPNPTPLREKPVTSICFSRSSKTFAVDQTRLFSSFGYDCTQTTLLSPMQGHGLFQGRNKLIFSGIDMIVTCCCIILLLQLNIFLKISVARQLPSCPPPGCRPVYGWPTIFWLEKPSRDGSGSVTIFNRWWRAGLLYSICFARSLWRNTSCFLTLSCVPRVLASPFLIAVHFRRDCEYALQYPSAPENSVFECFRKMFDFLGILTTRLKTHCRIRQKASSRCSETNNEQLI